MAVFASVRGAGQRQLLSTMVKLLVGVAGEDGQGLYRLDGGTRKYRPLDIASRGNDPPIRIDYHIGAAMPVLDPVATRGFGENWIGIHQKKLRSRLSSEQRGTGKVNIAWEGVEVGTTWNGVRRLDIGVVNQGQKLRIDPAPDDIAFNQAPIRSSLKTDAALDPDRSAGCDGAGFLGVAGRPFADIELVPLGNASDGGQMVHAVAGSHGRLNGQGTSGGDEQTAQGGDDDFFLLLVHFSLSIKSVAWLE